MVEVIDAAGLVITDRSDPQLIHATLSGGPGLNGDEQILSALSARWEWSAVLLVRDEVAARSLRWLRSKAKGRFNYIRLRICDRYRITRKDIGAVDPPDGVPFGDGAHFSDGSTWSLSQPSAPLVTDAAAGDETITVPASYFSGAVSAGVFFGLNDWLHQVDGWEEDGDNYVLTISPPLREDAAVGDEADFSGRSIWQLASDEEGGIDLSLGRSGTTQLRLIEPIGRRFDAS